MKRVILFRHAKSGWDDPALRDFDRPLNDRGRRAARLMGRHLKDADIAVDRVLASPAARVTQTLEAMAEGYGASPPVTWDRRLYLGADTALLDAVNETPAEVGTLMVAGHNPGLEDLALRLVPDDGDAAREAVEEKFPTAAIAVLRFEVGDWAAIDRGMGVLERFVRPRDLDPALGPEPAR